MRSYRIPRVSTGRWHRQLNELAAGQRIHAPLRLKQLNRLILLIRILDLQKNRFLRLVETRAVDLKRPTSELDIQLKLHIRITRDTNRVLPGTQVRFQQGLDTRWDILLGFLAWIDSVGSLVAQNGEVEPTGKARGTAVGVRAYPVVPDGLGGVNNDRVALARVDLDAVNYQRLGALSIGLDDSLKPNRNKVCSSDTVGLDWKIA